MKSPLRLPDIGEERLSRKQFFKYLCVYTLVFLLTFSLAFAYVILHRMSFVNRVDGRLQHFPWLVYIGREIRRVALDLLHGNFSLKLFDLNIGLGEDVMTFPASLGMLDPLAVLLTPFFPARYTEILYNLLDVFYQWLAGLSFSCLCFRFGKNGVQALIGAIVYAFSGAIGFGVTNFAFFTIGMAQLPLLVIGIDKIYRRERPYLYILAIFWACINKYYTFYMQIFPVGIYAVITYIFGIDRTARPTIMSCVRDGFVFLCRVVMFSLLGMGSAGIVFLPSVLGLLSSSRSGAFSYSQGFTPTYYRDLLLSVFTPLNGSCDYYGAGVFLFAAATLFMGGRKRRKLQVLFVIAVVCYLSAFVSYVMNGFQYLSTRWSFIIGLVFAYAVVEMYPELTALTKKQYAVCVAVFGLYTLFVLYNVSRGIGAHALIGVVFLGVTIAVLAMGISGKEGAAFPGRTAMTWLVLITVVLNIGAAGNWLLSPNHEDLAYGFHEWGFETERLEAATERAVEHYLLNDPEGRADGTIFYRNTGLVWRIPTELMSYNTVENGNVIEFWKKIELGTRNQLFNHYSTDHRTAVETLLSGKYYVAVSDSDPEVPYGYKATETTDEGYVIYENQYALPWGYTYDTAVSYEYMDSLNGLERQSAMLQAVALDSQTDQSELFFDIQDIPYELTCEGCVWEDGVLKVTSADASMTISYEAQPDAETYLRLQGFVLEDWQSQSVQVKYNGQSDATNHSAGRGSYYQDVEDYLYNIGRSAEGPATVTVTVAKKGEFELGGVELFAQSFENYPAQVEALRAEPLENIQWGTNSLTGTVDLSKDKILCVSVPYSKGWTATVDGEKVEILRGNYMFMCLPLTAGHHDIEFHYCSPGIKLGAVLTVCSAAIVTAMLVRDRTRKKKEQT